MEIETLGEKIVLKFIDSQNKIFLNGVFTIIFALSDRKFFKEFLNTLFQNEEVDNKKIVDLCLLVNELKVKEIGSLKACPNKDYSRITITYGDKNDLLIELKKESR